MLDPTLQMALTSAIEAAVQKALQYDPASRLALAKLQNQCLAVEITTPKTILYFIPNEEGVAVCSQFEETDSSKISTKITGSPLALAQLISSSQLNLADSGVEVFGSTGLLIELQTIFKQLDIDWEEAINDILGDLVGHQVANSVRSIFGWTRDRKKTMSRLVSEYLTEEMKTTPSKTELNNFYNQVTSLQLATDRISAKVDALKSALKKS